VKSLNLGLQLNNYLISVAIIRLWHWWIAKL